MVAAVCAAGAFGVRWGKPVAIRTAPWAVVVRETGEQTCTGVIIDPLHVLTAGHCLFNDPQGALVPASLFTIQAGVSNFKHPLASDRPQMRVVSEAAVIPGYIPTSRWTYFNAVDAAAHDLGILTLSSPLDLSGPDARAARLPSADAHEPSNSARLVLAGFGNEQPSLSAPRTDALNELIKPGIWPCTTKRTLCLWSTSGACNGDSGAGLVEPEPRPTVVGILSQNQVGCAAGLSQYVYLGTPAVLRFISASR